LRKKILASILVICTILFSNSSYADDELEEFNDSDLENIIETSAKCEDNILVNSRIFAVYDRCSGRIILGKDENKKSAMASTTKIMTAIVVIENSNLDDVVEVSVKAACTGGSRLGLRQGDKISVRDLLYGLMLKSGNDAAVALAEHVAGSVENFANLMNNKVRELDLKNTHFVTPHGLDNQNHYTTACELAKITDYSLNNEIFAKIVATKSYMVMVNGYPKNINNTNELLGNFAGVYGVKTGFTNNAGRCLVTAAKNENVDIITVVLQADTKRDRSNDSIKLINYVFKNYRKIDLEKMIDEIYDDWINTNLNRIHIDRAKKSKINLKRSKSKYQEIIVNSANIKDIDICMNVIYEYEAPVFCNTKVGEIQIFVENKLLENIDIKLENTIYAKDYRDYFHDCMEILSNII